MFCVKLLIVILQYNNICMGITNTEQFTSEQNEIALIAKALGHPARIAIIQHLLKVDSCVCRDIVEELPLAQPTISQHLKELKNANLIQGTVEGTSVCYCISEKGIEKFQHFFQNITTHLQKNSASCC